MTDFGALLGKLLEQTTLFPGEDVFFEVSFNPASGTLASYKKQSALLQSMEKLSFRYGDEREFAKSAVPRNVEVNMHPTQSREESLSAVLEAVDRLKLYRHGGEPGDNPRRAVLVLAGGDGFHKDSVTEIAKRNIFDLDEFILFRLPLGTGNDTPLETDLVRALELIFTTNKPVKDSLISVSARNREIDYALNVVSFGLDAYVCLLTEWGKGHVKGDIYRVMVDLAALFYDFYHVTKMSKVDIQLSDSEKGSGNPQSIHIEKRALLNVFGRKGCTNYGGGKKILPGPENLMLTGFLHIPGRVMFKGMFMKGSHYSHRKTAFYQADSMTLDYPDTLLMELDGEVTKLKRENFPVTLKTLPQRIRVLN